MTNNCSAGSLSYLCGCEKANRWSGETTQDKVLGTQCESQSLDIQNQVKAGGHNGQPVIPALEGQSSRRKQAAKISQ